MSCMNVLVMRLSGRMENAPQLQEVLTRHGCAIKARIGLHEAGDACANDGLLILQLCGEEKDISALHADVEAIEGVTAKMVSV